MGLGIKSENVGKLKVNTFEIPEPNVTTIIVGNAYGIMPYIIPLAMKLSTHSIQAYWFAFSGQENTEGIFSYKQCIEDISNVVDYLKNNCKKNSNINFLSHCAGSLFTLEYLRQSKDPSINEVVIYGLLYGMNRRRNIAERKLINCGVRYNLSEEDWAYNPLEAIEVCRSKILFCHAKDKLNFERATESDMMLAVSKNKNGSIKWFDKGYDDDNTVIDNYITTYAAFLNRLE